MPNVVFKFRRPSGSRQQEPSSALTEALRRLCEAAEMPSLIAQTQNSGRSVEIEVFQSRNCQPILIHFKGETA
jgi:hypothetical protein